MTKGTHTPADPEIALSRLVADQVETRVGSVQAMPEQPTAATRGRDSNPVELGHDSEREDAGDAMQPASAGDNASENGGPGRQEAAYTPSDATAREPQYEGSSLAAAGLANSQVVGLAHERSERDHGLLAQLVVAPTVGADGGDNSDATGMGSSCIFTTRVDEATAINPLVNGTDPGRGISHINGLPITTASPVDVGFGWVQLREDGWLTVTPDVGYRGRISFDYSATGIARDERQGHVFVDVGADTAPAAVALRNKITAVAEDVSTAAALKVADVAVADGELGTDGLSLTGFDASMFEIVDNALYLKQGIDLDFDAKPTLSVEILALHADGLDEGASFTLNVAGSGAAALAAATDMLVFASGYVETTGTHPLIDVSSIRSAVFQELMDAGALVQEGDNIVITFSPHDSADLQRIVLKGDAIPFGDADF